MAQIYTEAEKIRLLDMRGRLPLERACLECGAMSRDVLHVYIECERAEVRPNASPLMYVVIAILDPLGAYSGWLSDNDKEVVGEDVIVHAPLRVCEDCQPRFAGQNQLVRDLLQNMRLYEPLFRDYPDAAVRFSE